MSLDNPSSNFADQWGRVSITTDDALELVFQGIDISQFTFVNDEKLQQYNKWCNYFNKPQFVLRNEAELPERTPEEEREHLAASWHISEKYKDLPVRETLLELCISEVERQRVNMEMDLFEERGWIPMLRMLFTLVEHFRTHDIVWGVGRGSSVASYCLFLIGIHKINSIVYDLDIKEFLK